MTQRSFIEHFKDTTKSVLFAQEFVKQFSRTITDHDFSDAYEKAVEAKKVAEQEVEKTRFQTQKQQVEAENKVKVAEFAVKEKELEAKANAVMSQSLTPQLLEKMKYEKWDGKLPQVQGGNPIIKIEQNK